MPRSPGSKPTDTGPRSKLVAKRPPGRATGSSSPPFQGLCIIATPIGNAADITLRALDCLNRADVIACEDTRVTRKLLSIHEITTPFLAYHEHNAEKVRPRILERLRRGETVALVTDAGTPLVSDPGYKLVQTCIGEGLRVSFLPGASAPVAALVLSGLPSDRFFFAGFPPPRGPARRKMLAAIKVIDATLIFFESPRRLAASLADMAEIFGPRPAAVARELTKLYEEVKREKLTGLAEHYRASGPPKGEIVIVVGPPPAGIASADEAQADTDALLRRALTMMSLRDAAESVALATARPRREVYARALALVGEEATVKKKDRGRP